MSYTFTYNQINNFLNGNGVLLHCTHEAIKILELEFASNNIIELGNGFILQFPSSSTENEDEGLWQIHGYNTGTLACVTDEYFVKLPNGLYTALSEDMMQDFFRDELNLSDWLNSSAEKSAKHKQELQNA